MRVAPVSAIINPYRNAHGGPVLSNHSVPARVLGVLAAVLFLPSALAASSDTAPQTLALNDKGYFSARGLDVLVFNNTYDGNFSDSKLAGVELIHHDVRTATNGDVRLSPTPEQWDPVAVLEKRNVDRERGVIEAQGAPFVEVVVIDCVRRACDERRQQEQ